METLSLLATLVGRPTPDALVFSALPDAPVVADQPRVRDRLAGALVGFGNRLSPAPVAAAPRRARA